MDKDSLRTTPFADSLRTGMTSGVILSFIPFVKVFKGERTVEEAAAIWVVILPLIVISMTLIGWVFRRLISNR
ncbi:hypothetical protein KDK88_05670 [bacterium]|nr:hypothetical protein [bacterium]